MNQTSGFQVEPLGLVIPESSFDPASGLSPSESPMHSRQVSGHEASLVFLPVPVAYKVNRSKKVKVGKINSLKESHLTRLSLKLPKLTSCSFGKNNICIFSLAKAEVPAKALNIPHQLYTSEFSICQKPDLQMSWNPRKDSLKKGFLLMEAGIPFVAEHCPCQRNSSTYKWDAYEEDVEGIPVCAIYGQCEIVPVPSLENFLGYSSIDGVYENPGVHKESFEATDARRLRATYWQLVCYPSKVAGSGFYKSPDP